MKLRSIFILELKISAKWKLGYKRDVDEIVACFKANNLAISVFGDKKFGRSVSYNIWKLSLYKCQPPIPPSDMSDPILPPPPTSHFCVVFSHG